MKFCLRSFFVAARAGEEGPQTDGVRDHRRKAVDAAVATRATTPMKRGTNNIRYCSMRHVPESVPFVRRHTPRFES
jgi:hypothetical protein